MHVAIAVLKTDELCLLVFGICGLPSDVSGRFLSHYCLTKLGGLKFMVLFENTLFSEMFIFGIHTSNL